MPNWCNNEVTIHGEPEEVQRFKEFVSGKDADDDPFTFHSVLPLPKELKGFSPSNKFLISF